MFANGAATAAFASIVAEGVAAASRGGTQDVLADSDPYNDWEASMLPDGYRDRMLLADTQNLCTDILSCKAMNYQGVGRGTRDTLIGTETVKWGRYGCNCGPNGEYYEFVGPGRDFDNLKGVSEQHTPFKQFNNGFEIDTNSGYQRWKYETFIESFENNYQSIPPERRQ